MNKEDLAILFHDTYEILAPSFGYETREDTRKFDENSINGKLMIAVCGEILKHLEQVNELKKYKEMWETIREYNVVTQKYAISIEEDFGKGGE